MDLSIIIVNYNVKHFLQQCLQSVIDASHNISCEIIVVDNKSVDGSVAMVQEQFPNVTLIANKENVGYSRGNNAAIKIAKGDYALLLNPDTVVQEDTFIKCLECVRANPNIGGLGVKMIDGAGKYLPESKRGLPSPFTAFFKMTGISALFPTSKNLAKYYLGHLSKDESNEVEVLSGAFMLLKKSVIDEIGMLDEQFFMYGEDIDLSYRILLGGYKNYYLANTKIIHYKGESTKKGSLNYVKVFYNAMILYAQKHFSNRNQKVFVSLIKFAVYIKAGLAVIQQSIKTLWKPALEIALMALVCYVSSQLYQNYSDKKISELYQFYGSICQAALILGCFVATGAYKIGGGFSKIQKASLVALVASGFVYSLLPETLRFSRLLVIGNPILLIPIIAIERKILDRCNLSSFFQKENKSVLVVGTEENTQSIVSKIQNAESDSHISCWNPTNYLEKNDLKSAEQEIFELVRVHHIDELVFLNESLKNEVIIALMSINYSRNVAFKIVPRAAEFIIGSGSKDAQGDLTFLEPEPLFSKAAMRKKRWGDLLLCIIIFALSPYIFFSNSGKGILKNIFAVAKGKKTWVGLNEEFKSSLLHPNVFEGVINIAPKQLIRENIVEINRNYCKNYQFRRDFNLVLKNLNKLGIS